MREKGFLNKVKRDWIELKDIIRNENKMLKVNRILSNNIVMAVIITAMDILLLLLFNYFINSIGNLGSYIRDRENAAVYFSAKNCLLSFSRLRNSGVVRLLYIIFGIGIVILDAIQIHNIKVSFSEKGFNINQKGKARWTTQEEIKAQYKEIDESEMEYEGNPGFIISRIGNKLYIDDNFTNNLIIGITRSGKGETLVFPSIDVYSRAKLKPSIIVLDMKLELYKSSMKERTLQNRGYDVYMINLINADQSAGYNQLEEIISEWEKGNQSFAEELVQSLVWQIFDPDEATGNEKYFTATGANLFAGLIIGVMEDALRLDEEINERRKKMYQKKTANYKQLSDEEKAEVDKQYQTYLTDVLLDHNVDAIPDTVKFEKTHENRDKIFIYSIINTYFNLKSQPILDVKGNPTGKTMLDMFFEWRPEFDRAKMKYMSMSDNTFKTKANVYSTMTTKLNVYTLENVGKMTAESSFRIEDIGFGDRPMAIFLGIPQADTSKYDIVSCFIKQVYTILANQCVYKGFCKRPVKFIADEVGNFKIEDLPGITSFCAGMGITFDLYIQSYAQLEQHYNQGFKTIKSNCGNIIYIRSDDEATLKDISRLTANRSYVDYQRTGTKYSFSKNLMETVQEMPLIREEELAKLKQGENVIIRKSKVKDNDGNDVYMTPIFNSKENGRYLKFRYEYLEKYFPTPKYINLEDVIDESRAHIKLRSRCWNPEDSLRLLDRDQNEMSELRICDLIDTQMNALINALHKILDEQEIKKNEPLEQMSLDKAENFIQHSGTKISRTNQLSLLSLLDHYLKKGA